MLACWPLKRAFADAAVADETRSAVDRMQERIKLASSPAYRTGNDEVGGNMAVREKGSEGEAHREAAA
jgi:hypothetical protein